MEEFLGKSMDSTLTDKLHHFVSKSSSRLPPLQFYHEVQIAFHDVESEYYDDLHEDMYVYLEAIFSRLFSKASAGKERIAVLDIGAGTGLVETFLVKGYASLIERIDVVEPNGNMIARLQGKNREWQLPISYKNAYLENAELTGKYDIAICSSVLHHIPDLSGFFALLGKFMKPGGFILTMQDPRNEALQDIAALERKRTASSLNPSEPVIELSTVGKLKQLVKSMLRAIGLGELFPKGSPFEIRVNRLLKERKVIKKSLSIDEIWAITDIHVPDQPGGIGAGISLQQLQSWLPDFKTIDYLSYNFFNQNYLNLPAKLKELEMKYLREGDTHGFSFASLFQCQKPN